MSNDTPDRLLSFDTRPIPWDVLTDEEHEIIEKINNLIRSGHKDRQYDPLREASHKPWITPQPRRTARLVLIDGVRGAGKTSLLLTMASGWRDPESLWYDGIDKATQKEVERVFRDMDQVARCLKPLDFDPLPSDLPLYSWIIQAFEPLVRACTASSHIDTEQWTDSAAEPATLQEKFQKLRQAAVIGWVTSAMTRAHPGDISSTMVDLLEQHGSWHDLKSIWIEFIDDLTARLERSSNCLPKDAVIVLPIDDLDMQGGRVRELLLALRVLSHERVLYILTGDIGHLKVTLSTEFYQSFAGDVQAAPPTLEDEVLYESNKLARGLINKAFSPPHVFKVAAIPLSQAMTWSPDPEKIDSIGEMLDAGAQELAPSPSEFFKRRGGLPEPEIPVRRLQALAHELHSVRSDERQAVRKLSILLGAIADNAEEPLDVNRKDDSIEFSGGTGYYSLAPRNTNLVATGSTCNIRWITGLDFATKPSALLAPDATSSQRAEAHSPTQANPEHLLALDLAATYRDRFSIFNGPVMTSHSIGLAWSEHRGSRGMAIIPWPMPQTLSSPCDWATELKRLSEALSSSSTTSGADSSDEEEAMLLGWIRFITMRDTNQDDESRGLPLSVVLKSIESTTDLDPNRRDAVRALASPLYGLSKNLRARITRHIKGTRPKTNKLNILAKSSAFWVPSQFGEPADPWALAFRPTSPSSAEKDSLDRVLNRLSPSGSSAPEAH